MDTVLNFLIPDDTYERDTLTQEENIYERFNHGFTKLKFGDECRNAVLQKII